MPKVNEIKRGQVVEHEGTVYAIRQIERSAHTCSKRNSAVYVYCDNMTYKIQESIAMTTNARSARLGLRATPEQEAVLRRAAEVAHKSMTDFILDSACQAAEQTLLDQRLFLVSGSQSQALLDMLDRPVRDNPGVKELFSRPAPWDR